MWILVALVVAMFATGILLALTYEPGDDGLPGIHGALGLLTVLAALTVAVTTALDEERSTAGVLPAVVVLGVVAGMYFTGPALAYDQVATNGPVGSVRGILVLFDDDVGGVSRGNAIVDIADYRRIAWLHAGALPIALVVMGLAGIWAVRRRARAYTPRHAAGVAVPPTSDEAPPA